MAKKENPIPLLPLCFGVFLSVLCFVFVFDMGRRKKFSTISTTPDARHSQERSLSTAEGIGGVAFPRDETNGDSDVGSLQFSVMVWCCCCWLLSSPRRGPRVPSSAGSFLLRLLRRVDIAGGPRHPCRLWHLLPLGLLPASSRAFVARISPSQRPCRSGPTVQHRALALCC